MTDACQEWIAHCVKKYRCSGAVLEVGSFDVNGNPRHHFADKERFEAYTGIDMREGPCVDRVMNVQAMEFPDNHFGVVVDAERLEHDNRFWVSVKELYRVLKPGGYIIVTTRSWGGMHPHDYPHDYWRFMDAGLKDLLEYGGFQVLATAYGERWAAGDKAVFAVGRKPVPAQVEVREERRPFHIVIPSKNSDNLSACLGAIFKHEPALDKKQIIVVDDGLGVDFSGVGITQIPGRKPFIFARNANLGIKAAGSNVILLNDDAVLETPEGFTHLAKQTIGLVSAAIRGTVGNARQKPQARGLRPEKDMLCFVALSIPKWVQEKIGPLDERFTGYGFEDNDYCTRAKAANIPLFVYDGCVVEHESLAPTFRSRPGWQADMAKAQTIYRQKYL